MDRSFEPLSDAEIRYVSEQLARAHDFALALDPHADGARPSLESLDRAFENYLATDDEPSNADELVQAVGAAFGAELVEILGFQWVIATDEYGTDLAVLARPGRGDVTIFPAEFVAKRYERREAPFLVTAFAETAPGRRTCIAAPNKRGLKSITNHRPDTASSDWPTPAAACFRALRRVSACRIMQVR
jgi:Domain of unknown function (DUF3806)